MKKSDLFITDYIAAGGMLLGFPGCFHSLEAAMLGILLGGVFGFLYGQKQPRQKLW